MRKLLKRWYVWLGLVLLLGLAGSVALICSGRGRITQANFDRIQEGMTEAEVIAILGEPMGQIATMSRNPSLPPISGPVWKDRGSQIVVFFDQSGSCRHKDIRVATIRETLQWYAKKGAEKIGVTWD
jgi:hypothetical protein